MSANGSNVGQAPSSCSSGETDSPQAQSSQAQPKPKRMKDSSPSSQGSHKSGVGPPKLSKEPKEDSASSSEEEEMPEQSVPRDKGKGRAPTPPHQSDLFPGLPPMALELEDFPPCIEEELRDKGKGRAPTPPPPPRGSGAFPPGPPTAEQLKDLALWLEEDLLEQSGSRDRGKGRAYTPPDPSPPGPPTAEQLQEFLRGRARLQTTPQGSGILMPVHPTASQLEDLLRAQPPEWSTSSPIASSSRAQPAVGSLYNPSLPIQTRSESPIGDITLLETSIWYHGWDKFCRAFQSHCDTGEWTAFAALIWGDDEFKNYINTQGDTEITLDMDAGSAAVVQTVVKVARILLQKEVDLAVLDEKEWFEGTGKERMVALRGEAADLDLGFRHSECDKLIGQYIRSENVPGSLLKDFALLCGPRFQLSDAKWQELFHKIEAEV